MADPNPMERPTLLSSCARAATRDEARFRVQYPNSLTRTSTVIALDGPAAASMAAVREEPWANARFLTLAGRQPDVSPNDVLLVQPDGSTRLLSEEIEGTDVVVMIASTSEGRREAEIIGRVARSRAVMAAGIVVSAGAGTDAVVSVMRPTAAVLVIASSEDYLPAMLTALRA